MRLDSSTQPREGRGSGRNEGGRCKEGPEDMFDNDISTQVQKQGIVAGSRGIRHGQVISTSNLLIGRRRANERADPFTRRPTPNRRPKQQTTDTPIISFSLHRVSRALPPCLTPLRSHLLVDVEDRLASLLPPMCTRMQPATHLTTVKALLVEIYIFLRC